MKEHELRRVLRAADEAVTVDGLEELVRCLERGFDSNHASIARFGGPRGFDIAVGDKAAMNYEHYATHIFPQDEVLAAMGKLGSETRVLAFDVDLDARRLRETGTFCEYYGPQRFHTQINAWLTPDVGNMTEGSLGIGIFREKGVAYNQNDKRQLAAILPALEAAVHRVFRGPTANADALTALLAASIPRPCLLLDPAGRLLWASPSATPLIARDGGGAPPAVVRAARELVASTRMGADASSAPRRVRFDGEGGASIWISLRLLRMSNGGLSVVAECSAALDPQALVDRLGVSRAEAAVLALLADGQANAAIATRLHVSTETVKTHVRNVLRKLGTRSRVQAALIALGCLPPGADGTDGESAEDG